MELFFVIVVFLPVALEIVVWLRLRDKTVGDISTPWRKQIAYVGLATNCLAFAMPWGLFLYNYILLNRGRPVSGDEMIDVSLVAKGSLALAALSLALGILGPKHVRILLILSALSVGCFWLLIPVGIL